MKLYEVVPKRSVRQGLFESLSAFDGVSAIEFGPEGTMHYLSVALSGGKTGIYTSGLREKDVIFGDTGELEKAVLEIDSRVRPEFLVLVSSCVSEIIGADLKAVAARLNGRTGAELMAADNLSLDMDYSDGCALAYQMIAAKMLPLSQEVREEGTYLILGLYENDYRGKSDFRELRQLLTQYMGLTCLNKTGGRVEIQRLGKASFHVVVRQEALVLAKELERRYGIPYIYPAPYGAAGTRRFLDRAAGLTGNTYRDSDLFREDYETAGNAIRSLKRYLGRKKRFSVLLYGGYDRVAGLTEFLKKECGIPEVTGICRQNRFDLLHDVTVLPDREEAEFLRLTEEIAPDVFLGDGIYCRHFSGKYRVLQIQSPSLDTADLCASAPFMGLTGAAGLAEALING